MSFSYQPQSVSQHFDEFGEQEWDRLVKKPSDEVSLHIHTHYLQKYITPEQRVLEIGAGAGRFTQILATLGAKILVADISSVQLELNRKYAAHYGFANAVEGWHQLDMCDLSRFASHSFDAVVAYGGPFSYVLDKRDGALLESIRMLKPNGILLLSVMSLWGSAHGGLDNVLALSLEVNQKIVATGDITPATFPQRRGNFMHLFRADELLGWLKKVGLQILDASASNSISLAWNEKLKDIRSEPEKWNELLRMELEACADSACLGLGTHMIVVARAHP